MGGRIARVSAGCKEGYAGERRLSGCEAIPNQAVAATEVLIAVVTAKDPGAVSLARPKMEPMPAAVATRRAAKTKPKISTRGSRERRLDGDAPLRATPLRARTQPASVETGQRIEAVEELACSD